MLTALHACAKTYAYDLEVSVPFCNALVLSIESLNLFAEWVCTAALCSDNCQAVIAMIAQKLGNEDAALYRFTHPVKPDQPMTAASKPALSNTVVERDPSQKDSQNIPKTETTKPQPSQLQNSQSSVQQSSKGKAGIAGPSHPPRKGSQAGPQYAAGSAKTPIMLAEIQVTC